MMKASIELEEADQINQWRLLSGKTGDGTPRHDSTGIKLSIFGQYGCHFQNYRYIKRLLN